MIGRSLAILALLAVTPSCSGNSSPSQQTTVADDTPPTNAAPPPDAAPATTNVTEARVLLTSFVDSVRALAQGAGAEAILGELDSLARHASAAARHGQLADEFFNRYSRVLRVTRLAVTPIETGDDTTEMEREIESFVLDVTGDELDLDEGGGLAAIAEALIEEVIRLHLLIDPSATRLQVEDRYDF